MLYYDGKLFRKMTRGQFLSRFKNSTQKLIESVEDEVDLEYDYPDLYKEVYDYYKERNVYLYDDKDKDYNIIMEELEYDLMNAGVMA
tara:strand:- start:16 stop:276 length:261 start_codon:yes stop_codon:yes gene_type:complete